jgi:hypothetical protein
MQMGGKSVQLQTPSRPLGFLLPARLLSRTLFTCQIQTITAQKSWTSMVRWVCLPIRVFKTKHKVLFHPSLSQVQMSRR